MKFKYVIFYFTSAPLVEERKMRVELEAESFRQALMMLEKSASEMGVPVGDVISLTRMDVLKELDS